MTSLVGRRRPRHKYHRHRRRGSGWEVFTGLFLMALSPGAIVWQCFGQAHKDGYAAVWRQRFLGLLGIMTLVTVSFISLELRLVDKGNFADRPLTGGRRVSEVPYADLINSLAAQSKLDPSLVAAVIKVESSYNPLAVSHTGAKGLMQLMPATWREVMPDSSCSGEHLPPARERDCIYRPDYNIKAGTRYLVWLGNQCEGSGSAVLAAYNGGILYAWQNRSLFLKGSVAGETPAYIKSVMSEWERLSPAKPFIVRLWQLPALQRTLSFLVKACAALWGLCLAHTSIDCFRRVSYWRQGRRYHG